MSIIKDLEIKINNGNARLNDNVYIYQNDRGVELRFKLDFFKDDYSYTARSLVFESENMYAAATVLKPDGSATLRKKSTVVDNIITFAIDEEFANHVDMVGTYKIQFHIYDEDNNRITIPPVQFQVKELIANLDDGFEGSKKGIVDISLADSCYVTDDNEMDISIDGRYIKTVWKSGDLISSIKLNKIENALESFDDKFSSILTDDDYINIEAIKYENSSYDNIKNLKDALDKLLYSDLVISVSSNIPFTLEKGMSISNATINWNYNKNIISQTFDSKAIDINIRSYTHAYTFSTDRTFTLSANDGSKTFSKIISFKFLNGVYYGVSSKTDYNSNFIMGLSKELKNSKAKTFTVNCNEGEYIYFCIPTSYGTPIFTVGGFSGGFSKVSSIQYKNSHGYTENYAIYKSTNSNLGNTTVVVS